MISWMELFALLKFYEKQKPEVMPRGIAIRGPLFITALKKVSGVVIRKSAGLLSIGIDMLFVISRIMVT